MNTLRKILLTLMVVGAVGSTVSAGTFASFTSRTTNTASTFSAGTLVLGNQVDTATMCLSNAGGAVNGTHLNNNCDTAVAVTVRKPGDLAEVDLSLQNLGSIDGLLTAYASQNCVAGNALSMPFNGTGNACTTVRMTIEEFASQADRTNDIPMWCWYGGLAGTSACDIDGTGLKTVFNWHSNHPTSGAAPLDLGAIEAGDTRYFRISLKLPVGASDQLQGKMATFGYIWRLDQA